MADQGLSGPNNRICQICQHYEATHLCKCTDTPTLLCMQCFSTHQAKYPHQVLSVAAINPEEYKRRYEALIRTTAELRSNVDRMEQCSREFGDMMQKCINYLVEYRTWWLQQLQTEKEELVLAIETAIREVTDCLDQGVEPGRAVWTFPNEELQVFKYTMSTPDLPELCKNWASYENDLKRLCLLVGPMQPVSVAPVQSEEAKVPLMANKVEAIQPAAQSLFQLVHVTSSYIRVFDFQRETWKQPLPLNSHIQADSGSSWVILEGGSVFICGGGAVSGWSTAYVVGKGCVEQVLNMQVARCYHGVLVYSKQVYVFGGYNKGGLNSCEKYRLQQHTWTLLPPMQEAKSYFNPCLFNGSIYLCGYGSTLLEEFSPQTDLMLSFLLFMPASSYCCMYVEDNLLVVHLNRNILKFRAGQAELLVQTSTSSTREDVRYNNSQPVVNTALRLYYIVQNGSCYRVNMDTGAVDPAIK